MINSFIFCSFDLYSLMSFQHYLRKLQNCASTQINFRSDDTALQLRDLYFILVDMCNTVPNDIIGSMCSRGWASALDKIYILHNCGDKEVLQLYIDAKYDKSSPVYSIRSREVLHCKYADPVSEYIEALADLLN